jgi:hypothetical protein
MKLNIKFPNMAKSPYVTQEIKLQALVESLLESPLHATEVMISED